MQMKYEETIVPISELTILPAFLIATTANFPPRSVPEFISYAKEHPGKVRFVSAGVGSYPQFDMAIFAKKTSLDLIHLPAKGGAADMINTLATGDTQVAFVNVASSSGLIKAGRLQPLAVTTDRRLADYPEVPTMAELGYPGIGTNQWTGLFIKAGTPKEIVDLLYREVVKALNSDQAKKVFGPANIDLAVSSSPAEATKWLHEETAKWRRTIEIAQIHLE
jgi:tripartite-type tricarboxylate transporter receptor subunit TctC